MAEYDFKDVAAFKGVWVFCEQRGGEIMPTDEELISRARILADELGEEVVGLTLGGKGIAEKAKVLGGYGADKIIAYESDLLDVYTTDAYTKVIVDSVKEFKPSILLIGATNIGRDLGPRIAARLHTGLCADCTHLDGGHLMATIICPRFRPQMATCRPGVMKRQAFDQAKADAIVVETPAFELTAADLQTKVLSVEKAAKKLVDLIGADIIVSVGRGISKDVEGGIKLAEALAEELGGVVGSSRAVVDSGWISPDHQVGQTGKTVHPKLYIALGISGAIQHLAGMQESECIIAVNKNDTAPIFEVADYGICGDLFKVAPLLLDAIKAAKADK